MYFLCISLLFLLLLFFVFFVFFLLYFYCIFLLYNYDLEKLKFRIYTVESMVAQKYINAFFEIRFRVFEIRF